MPTSSSGHRQHRFAVRRELRARHLGPHHREERRQKDLTSTTAYRYDLAGRLGDIERDGTPTASYAYDANGNRLVGPGLSER